MTEQRPAPTFERAVLATLIIVVFILAVSMAATAVSAATLGPDDDLTEQADWRNFEDGVEAYMAEMEDIGQEAQTATSREVFATYVGEALRVTIVELDRFQGTPPAPLCAGPDIDSSYLSYLEYSVITLAGLYYNSIGGLLEGEEPAPTELAFQIQDHFFQAFSAQRAQASRDCETTGGTG